MPTLQATTYRLVFDATTVRYPASEWLLPLALFAAFGVALASFPRLSEPERRRFVRPFGALSAIVAGAMAVGIWRTSEAQRSQVVGALRDGRYQLVEGVVEGFRPGAASSHPPEEFTVSGHRYRYAPAEHLYGFNQVAALGGPIRNGLRVRIAEVDGLIARLEVAP
jgi:hypothetical protein